MPFLALTYNSQLFNLIANSRDWHFTSSTTICNQPDPRSFSSVLFLKECIEKQRRTVSKPSYMHKHYGQIFWTKTWSLQQLCCILFIKIIDWLIHFYYWLLILLFNISSLYSIVRRRRRTIIIVDIILYHIVLVLTTLAVTFKYIMLFSWFIIMPLNYVFFLVDASGYSVLKHHFLDRTLVQYFCY